MGQETDYGKQSPLLRVSWGWNQGTGWGFGPIWGSELPSMLTGCSQNSVLRSWGTEVPISCCLPAEDCSQFLGSAGHSLPCGPPLRPTGEHLCSIWCNLLTGEVFRIHSHRFKSQQKGRNYRACTTQCGVCLQQCQRKKQILSVDEHSSRSNEVFPAHRKNRNVPEGRKNKAGEWKRI